MRGRLRILLAIGVLLAATRVDAHHFFGASYLLNKSVTLEGELAKVVFRNPHSLVHLVVRDKDGREVRYAVELAGAGQLEEKGVTSDTLKVGDHVVVTGSPGRFPADRRLRMMTLHRPKDNYNYDGRREP